MIHTNMSCDSEIIHSNLMCVGGVHLHVFVMVVIIISKIKITLPLQLINKVCCVAK